MHKNFVIINGYDEHHWKYRCFYISFVNMKNRVIFVVLSLLSLMFSVSMYTDWRGYDHGLFTWGQVVFPFDLPQRWIGLLGTENESVLLYNIPDGLWMFALCAMILAVWGMSEMYNVGIWLFLALMSGVILEIFQYTGLVPGTFDWFDIYAYFIALGCIVFLSQIQNKLKWKAG